jgi:hypothetical protein
MLFRARAPRARVACLAVGLASAAGATPPLVDNLDEPTRALTDILLTTKSSLFAAQSFETDTSRYAVTTIDMRLGELVGAGTPFAELRVGPTPDGRLISAFSFTVPPGPVEVVPLSLDRPAILQPSTRYWIVVGIRDDEATYKWAYAEGNASSGTGFITNYSYSEDLGVTWTDFGSENPYHIRVNTTCTGDINADGVIDFNDLLAFLNLYNDLDPAADFDGDGVIDFNDLLAFINEYNLPC